MLWYALQKEQQQEAAAENHNSSSRRSSATQGMPSDDDEVAQQQQQQQQQKPKQRPQHKMQQQQQKQQQKQAQKDSGKEWAALTTWLRMNLHHVSPWTGAPCLQSSTHAASAQCKFDVNFVTLGFISCLSSTHTHGLQAKTPRCCTSALPAHAFALPCC